MEIVIEQISDLEHIMRERKINHKDYLKEYHERKGYDFGSVLISSNFLL